MGEGKKISKKSPLGMRANIPRNNAFTCFSINLCMEKLAI